MTIRTADVIKRELYVVIIVEDAKKIVAKSVARKTKRIIVIYVIKTNANV